MRIHIHYKTTDHPWGGGNSFVRALSGWLATKPGVELVGQASSDVDIFFLSGASRDQNSYIDLQAIKRFRRPFLRRSKASFVFRLDGFRSLYANRDSPMDAIQFELLGLADHVIFQTRYCLETVRQLGVDFSQSYDVIHNAVDGDIFFPSINVRRIREPLRVMAASWSPNSRKGHAHFAELSKSTRLVCDFYGNWCNDIDPINVHVHPPIDRLKLADAYRGHDIFFHASLDDACPNVVCEALASGLPVICLDSGGGPELVGKYGAVLPREPDVEHLLRAVHAIDSQYEAMRASILEARSQWTMASVGEQYLGVFRKVLK